MTLDLFKEKSKELGTPDIIIKDIISIINIEFKKSYEEHQEKSRTASA